MSFTKNLNKLLLIGAVLIGINRGNSTQTEFTKFKPYPLVTSQILYQAAENASNGTITTNNIIECIDSTIKYYESVTAIPSGFSMDFETWKNAKIVETLRSISNCFQDLEITPYCTVKIMEICCGDKSPTEVKDKNFRYARFLIISQCQKWDEISGNNIELVKAPIGSTIGTAIGMLQSATNGDTEASERLLHLLKASKKFTTYLGE